MSYIFIAESQCKLISVHILHRVFSKMSFTQSECPKTLIKKFNFVWCDLPYTCLHIIEHLHIFNALKNGVTVDFFTVLTGNIVRHVRTFDLTTHVKKYDIQFLDNLKIETVDEFVKDVMSKGLTSHDAQLLTMFVKSDLCRGLQHTPRLCLLAQQKKLKVFCNWLCNVVYERIIEPFYPIGQQIAISTSTSQMQEGLNFKHNHELFKTNNLWFDHDINIALKKHTMLQITQITKKKNNWLIFEIKNVLIVKGLQQKWSCELRFHKNPNLIAILVNNNEAEILNELSTVILQNNLNLLIITDCQSLFIDNFRAYVYFTLKYFYYLVTEKFVYEYADHKLLWELYIIICMQWNLKGNFTTFGMNNNDNFHPLTAYQRRIKCLEKAAAVNRIVANDVCNKLTWLEGKQMEFGAGSPNIHVRKN